MAKKSKPVPIEAWINLVYRLLCRLLGCPPESLTLNFIVGGKLMSTATIHDDDTKGVTATLAFLDRAGQPTTPDDVPAWSCTDTTIATVTPAADGLTAQVMQLGKIGRATINVTSTESDGTQLSGSGDIIVTSGEAATVEITFAANP